jgi:hypothetical protein
MPDVYYNPENYGLQIIGDVDWMQGESYEYWLSVVWVDEDGQLYYDSDSGCSCYTPFDEVQKDDLTKVNFFELVDIIRGEQMNHSQPEQYEEEIVELFTRIRLHFS